ncbi:hydroxymethylglutaryl-CoA reductase, degradative [Weissella paramesenteroides]|jgi:hydroxymethylglutaryl-CoA reductase|uniref:3-hydroxy-3-methylglutaryl coenzyme A reductase n=1 Tax=Weissella paramesenteroides ATCC 33313 TaxID=585506 RepID=C5RA01_WEIPA|nr:hydroxymethylglutaryl-CoA reductase, degradative [Weissella paramesenteroides]ATF41991.1 hydroxymethylglutaryl-CoA reductase, degradative [Weissella paramesenteroides]EER75023.1 hydroxymethylglutaryl-CoA reductase, degradative [Weissella paramesenteroides ATCC 33313]KAA8446086.1 hydroxymethylglutaryl-CoA reductase, degradative [Weissella paramesenteroides]KAA8453002.1 hydroxymethylglutaryl-CoA reductase, degradative [Weissella paramesenteroides]MCT0485992.1 hydroxymethylglutaryl-CoA reducta
MTNWHSFYKRPWSERLTILTDNQNLTIDEQQLMQDQYDDIGAQQVENYIYNFGVPTGLLLQLPVDGQEFIVPMTTEEPSVIAAANNGARMMRQGSGVKTKRREHLMRGQIMLVNLSDMAKLQQFIQNQELQLLQIANDAHPSMAARGGGAKQLTIDVLDENTAAVNVLIDTKEAMGANTVNTMAEAVATQLRQQGYQVLMAILSNYGTEALVEAEVAIPVTALATKQGVSGQTIAEKIALASHLEELSPHRAVTSNKGILNGIEAVVLASGNDTRAVNAALHAYAAHTGQYSGLISWQVEHDQLVGRTVMPMSIGVVGGSIGIVPAVKLNHHIMGNPSAEQLAGIIIATGLAQNLAALRALVSTGIQAGHMALQAKSLAIQVGAMNDEVEQLVAQLNQTNQINAAMARQLLQKMRDSHAEN